MVVLGGRGDHRDVEVAGICERGCHAGSERLGECGSAAAIGVDDAAERNPWGV